MVLLINILGFTIAKYVVVSRINCFFRMNSFYHIYIHIFIFNDKIEKYIQVTI